MACHEGRTFNYTHEDHFCYNCKYITKQEYLGKEKYTLVSNPLHPCYACLFAEDNNVQHVCNWRKAEHYAI